MIRSTYYRWKRYFLLLCCIGVSSVEMGASYESFEVASGRRDRPSSRGERKRRRRKRLDKKRRVGSRKRRRRRYEDDDYDEAYESEEREGERVRTYVVKEELVAVSEREKVPPNQTIILLKERGWMFLERINPLRFLIGYIFTFPVTHFVIDQIIKHSIRIGHTDANMLSDAPLWKKFIYEGLLLYTLHILAQGVKLTLKPLLSFFRQGSMMHRLFKIVFSTSFVGISILVPQPLSFMIILGGVLLLSLATMREQKEEERSAYLMVNAFCAMLAMFMIQLVWFLFVKKDYFDGFLHVCTIHHTRKALHLRQMMMAQGNIGFIRIWQNIKDYIYISDGNNGYMRLNDLFMNQRSEFILTPAIEYIYSLSSPLQEIVVTVLRNVIFGFARELFL